MATKFDIKLFTNEIISDIENKAIKWINKWLSFLENKIDDYAPVDTWEYESHNKKIEARIFVWKVEWQVFNDSINAENVEYWWRISPVNWHKNKKKWWHVIYNWVWARVYTRAKDNHEQEVINIIKKEIW